MKPPKTTGQSLTPAAIQRYLELNYKVLSNISFGSTIESAVAGTPAANTATQDRNIVNYKASGTAPATPFTPFTINHNLNTIPVGFHVIQATAPAHIYGTPTFSTPWTASTPSALGTITLLSDTANVQFVIMIY